MSRSSPKSALRPWFGLIRHGESAVAPAGLALIGVLAVAMIAAGWWAMRSQDQTLQDARIQEVRAAGDVLAESAETLMQTDELSALRRLVMGITHHHDLDRCRIVLPDGSVLADGDPAQITLISLPPEWAMNTQAAPIQHMVGTQMTLRYPLQIVGRGGITLEITAGPRLVDAAWVTEAGIGVIGVCALIVLLIIYRQMRGQVRPLAAISESLGAMADGESTTAALKVSPKLGRLAESWNGLLLEREGKWDDRVEQEVKGSLAARHSHGSDLADACNALSQGLVLVDDHQQVLYANGAAAVFLGRGRDELIGSAFAALEPDDALAKAVARAAAGASRQRQTIEVEHLTGASDGVLRFSVRPITCGESPAVLVVIDDVTQHRVAERSRNTFIAQATHELRMPLTNIRLYVETALESGDDDAKLRGECLNVINNESRRLEGLVSDMLSISEIEAGSMTLQLGDVRLDVLFEELEKDYRAQADDKSIEMTFDLPPKLPVVQADRERLFIALQNLLGNALKYTPRGGNVALNVEASVDELIIEVKDTGIGISEVDAEHVFDRFYRAEDRRVRDISGSGLGLALSREIARLHGGDITLESEIDRGSTFILTFPINVEAV